MHPIGKSRRVYANCQGIKKGVTLSEHYKFSKLHRIPFLTVFCRLTDSGHFHLRTEVIGSLILTVSLALLLNVTGQMFSISIHPGYGMHACRCLSKMMVLIQAMHLPRPRPRKLGSPFVPLKEGAQDIQIEIPVRSFITHRLNHVFFFYVLSNSFTPRHPPHPSFGPHVLAYKFASLVWLSLM